MVFYKKSIVQTGIIIIMLCVFLTAGCQADSKKSNVRTGTENETRSVAEETTTTIPTEEESSQEPELMETDSTRDSATAPESAQDITETEPETTTKQPETTTEVPPVIEPMPGISVVSGYVTSGAQYKEYWTDLSLEIAASLYTDFLPCAVEIDGTWKKGLYHEEQNLLIVEDGEKWSGDIYTIYHGDEAITVPVGRRFPDDVFIKIMMVDVNGDGKDELYIDAFLGETRSIVSSVRFAISLEPFMLMTDIYRYKGNNEATDIRDENLFVPECRIVSAEAAEEGAVKVQAEFIMESGDKYTLDMEIDDADLNYLDSYKIYLTGFVLMPLLEDGGTGWKFEQKFNFVAEEKTDTGVGRTGGAYVTIRIGLVYDEESGRYIQGDDVKIEYGPYHFYY